MKLEEKVENQAKPFASPDLYKVAGCLRYSGSAKTLEEMNEAIAKGIQAQKQEK